MGLANVVNQQVVYVGGKRFDGRAERRTERTRVTRHVAVSLEAHLEFSTWPITASALSCSFQQAWSTSVHSATAEQQQDGLRACSAHRTRSRDTPHITALD